MTLRTACKNFQKDNNFLIFWEEENSVSVIFGEDVRCAEKNVGNECHVAINGTDYKGKIAAKGTKEEMKLLEKDFISGKYTPFAKDQGEVPKKTVTKRPGPAQGDDSGASAKATTCSTAVKKPRKSTQPEPGKILCISSQSSTVTSVVSQVPVDDARGDGQRQPNVVSQVPVEANVVSQVPVEANVVSQVPVEASVVSQVSVEANVVSQVSVEANVVSQVPMDDARGDGQRQPNVVSQVLVESNVVSQVPVEASVVSQVSVEANVVSQVPMDAGSEGGFQCDFGDPHMHMGDDDSCDSNISIPGLDPVVMLSIIQDLELRLKHVEQMLGIHVSSQSLITCPRPMPDHLQSISAPTVPTLPAQPLMGGMSVYVPPPCSTPVTDQSQIITAPSQPSPYHTPTVPMLPAQPLLSQIITTPSQRFWSPPYHTPAVPMLPAQPQIITTPSQRFWSPPYHTPAVPTLPAQPLMGGMSENVHVPPPCSTPPCSTPPCSTPVTDQSQIITAPSLPFWSPPYHTPTVPTLPTQPLMGGISVNEPPPCSTPVSDRFQINRAPTQSATEVCTRASTLPLLPRQLLCPDTCATTSAPIVQVPQPLPIPEGTTASKELPSSAIRREALSSVEVVLAQTNKLKGESRAGTLAQKLAKECIFGEDVLKQCTPLGTSTLPALPSAELKQLKRIMLQQFPQYWRAPEDFETIWSKCLEAIQQCCKRLRKCA